MSPAEHNKTLGILHLVYGGFFTLIAFAVLLVVGGLAGLVSAVAATESDAPPAALFWVFAVFFFLLYLVLSVPSLVAGYAMLRGKPWARVAGLVASAVAAMSFPFGTALCVYSLWFFCGEAGKAFERQSLGAARPHGSLNHGGPHGVYAQTFGHEREPAYRPPAEPPDWRSE